MALFCACIKRDLIPFLRFPIRKHVRVFWFAVSPIWSIDTIIFLPFLFSGSFFIVTIIYYLEVFHTNLNFSFQLYFRFYTTLRCIFTKDFG